eukprot:4078791-Pleurochrysis_carterae.AAC.1
MRVWSPPPKTFPLITDRRVGLALYARSNRKSVGSPQAVPLGSAPPTSGIYVSSFNIVYAALRSAAEQDIRTRGYGGAASVPLDRFAGGVQGVAERLCDPRDHMR